MKRTKFAEPNGSASLGVEACFRSLSGLAQAVNVEVLDLATDRALVLLESQRSSASV